MAIGRLKPGATQSQAQTEMSVIANRLEQAYPATNKGVGAKVVPLHDALYGGGPAVISTLFWGPWSAFC
jgi:putative ABC transport system permease protein